MASLASPVNVTGMGEVHSAGVMILAAATGDRLVLPHTILGYHAPAAYQESLVLERYVDFMEGTANLPGEWLRMQNDEMMIFTADEAVDYGVADRVLKAR